MKYWQHWKYQHLTLLFLSIIVSFFLFQIKAFHTFLLGLGNLGYLGAFISGILFVSTYTFSIAAVVLFILAESMPIITLSLLAGLGAAVGDLAILKLVRDGLVDEVKDIYERLGGRHLASLFHSKYFSWTLPVLGAIIIASPLPDELGVSLIGISKMKIEKFIVLSFILNSVGIYLIVSATKLIHF